MNQLASNLRILRKRQGLTQAQLAEKLGVNRSLIGAYEEGRSEPRLATLQLLAHILKVGLQELILGPLSGDEPRLVQRQSLRVLPVAVESTGEERVSLIPQKAVAGYTQGYADYEYIEQLRSATLPFPELQAKGTLRIFQIEGDSMLPVPSGAYVIGSYVERWQDLKSGQCYVLLTANEGIVYKRIENRLESAGHLVLCSDNPSYRSYSLPPEELLEAWEATGFIQFQLPDEKARLELENQKLMQVLDELRADLRALQQKVDEKA